LFPVVNFLNVIEVVFLQLLLLNNWHFKR